MGTRHGRDSLYWQDMRPIPLTSYELKGYRVMDSISRVQNAEEAAELDSVTITVGSQSGVQVKSKSDFKIFDLLLGGSYNIGGSTRFAIESPLNKMHFNTVDGIHFEYAVRFYNSSRSKINWNISPAVRYAFARKKVNYQLKTSLTGGPRFRKWAWVLEGGVMPSQLNQSNPIHPIINSFMTVLFEQNYMKLYERDFVLLGFQKDFSSKLKLEAEAEWTRNTHLQNHSTFKVFDSKSRSYTSNTPYNVEIGDTEFPRYKKMTFKVGLSARPWLKYRIRNGRKRIIDGSSPTLSLGMDLGVKGLFGSDISYSQIQAGFKHTFPFAGGGLLNLNVNAGTFLHKDAQYFPDFQHFAGNRTPFATLDPVVSFGMLDYYNLSTQSSYLNAHVHYQFRKLLATQLLEVRLMGVKETFFMNVLETKYSDHYFELGYGLNYIFRVFRLEVISQWQDFKYRNFGVRLGIATNLDNLFN